MTQRINPGQLSPDAFKKFIEFTAAAKQGAIEATIFYLVVVRIAQLNGCAFCLDMHIKQAKIQGERELRLYHLAGWWESPLFAPRERAALAWAEALTRLPDHGVPDDLYERVRAQLSEKEVSDLSFIAMQANAWNRLHIGCKTVPGSSDVALGLDKAQLG